MPQKRGPNSEQATQTISLKEPAVLLNTEPSVTMVLGDLEQPVAASPRAEESDPTDSEAETDRLVATPVKSARPLVSAADILEKSPDRRKRPNLSQEKENKSTALAMAKIESDDSGMPEPNVNGSRAGIVVQKDAGLESAHLADSDPEDEDRQITHQSRKRLLSHNQMSLSEPLNGKPRLNGTGDAALLESDGDSADSDVDEDANTQAKPDTDISGPSTKADDEDSSKSLEQIEAAEYGEADDADIDMNVADDDADDDVGLNGDDEDEEGPDDDATGADADEDADDQGDEEKRKKRQEAVDSLTNIEIEFASFRDRLHQDQLSRLELELRMCNDGTHPELESVYATIQDRQDERLRRARQLFEYQIQCITTQTKAMRAHLHQQFLKDRFDLRSELLCKTTREWYQVNYERRAADNLVPDFGYRAETIRQQSDVPELVALSKQVGFPAAPEMSSANEYELVDDLTALGLR